VHVALRVAVACPVGGACRVKLAAASAGGFHFRQVQGAVHTAGEQGDVDVKGEFLVEEVQEFVVLFLSLLGVAAFFVDEVDARRDGG
jgi:hypothetical protein